MKYFLLFMMSLGALACFSSDAKADLSITPTLIVFEDGERFENVTLINHTDEARTYAMSWRFFKMNESGASYTPIKESQTEFDVSKAVFFTPRRVTIPASRPQKIKLALRRPKEIPPGDYHAHLQFSPIIEVPSSVDENGNAEESASAGVGINVGYSIPIVVRAGNVQQGVDVGQVSLKRSQMGKLLATVPLTRSPGPYGVLSHMYIYHIDGNGEELIGEISNANIFPEVEHREFEVPLIKEIQSGKIKVKLVSPEDKNDVLAEEIFPLN